MQTSEGMYALFKKIIYFEYNALLFLAPPPAPPPPPPPPLPSVTNISTQVGSF